MKARRSERECQGPCARNAPAEYCSNGRRGTSFADAFGVGSENVQTAVLQDLLQGQGGATRPRRRVLGALRLPPRPLKNGRRSRRTRRLTSPLCRSPTRAPALNSHTVFAAHGWLAPWRHSFPPRQPPRRSCSAPDRAPATSRARSAPASRPPTRWRSQIAADIGQIRKTATASPRPRRLTWPRSSPTSRNREPQLRTVQTELMRRRDHLSRSRSGSAPRSTALAANLVAGTRAPSRI